MGRYSGGRTQTGAPDSGLGSAGEAGAEAAKSKKFTLPAQSLEIGQTTPMTLKFKYPKKASKAGKKSKAMLTGNAVDDFDQAAPTNTFKVKVKKKKK